MTIDWNSPSAFAAEYSAFIKQQYILCGLYIWELILGFGFDWELLKRKDRRPWSSLAKWCYFGCRYVPMMTLATLFVGFRAPSGVSASPTSCRPNIDFSSVGRAIARLVLAFILSPVSYAYPHDKAWTICVYAIGFSAIGFSSALIAIRANALWNRSKFMAGASITALSLQASGWIYRKIFSIAEGFWSATTSGCAGGEVQKNRVYITITFLVDIFLLVSMFLGLTKRRGSRTSGTGLWRILWHQGLIWIALATIAHVPTLTLLYLNLNQIMDEMFFTPEWMILAIASARMYRTLLAHFTATYSPNIALSPSAQKDPSGTPEDIPLRLNPLHAGQRELGIAQSISSPIDIPTHPHLDYSAKDVFPKEW
ncbi:hypothetical protein PENSPDRAFT_758848 [Peniophora sp. CONT]|nr:hypothetical protein PENSPDRAFT_758848 [Peniophora sp. CONT]